MQTSTSESPRIFGKRLAESETYPRKVSVFFVFGGTEGLSIWTAQAILVREKRTNWT